MLGIISSFDGGNIEVVKADDPSDIQLKIRSDTNADFFQCRMQIFFSGSISEL